MLQFLFSSLSPLLPAAFSHNVDLVVWGSVEMELVCIYIALTGVKSHAYIIWSTVPCGYVMILPQWFFPFMAASTAEQTLAPGYLSTNHEIHMQMTPPSLLTIHTC